MPRRITLKNGKSFTYLTPEEKVNKYEVELLVNEKLAYKYENGKYSEYPSFKYKKGQVKNGIVIQKNTLTSAERKYREDYINAYYNSQKSKGFKNFSRDLANFNNRKEKL